MSPTFAQTHPARMKSYVAYLRVSTQKQGQSGLGLAAQRAAVQAFPPVARLVAEFVEVESGKKNERPQLAAALALAKATGATLLIAKLDRLSRNAGFIFQLRDAGVDFVCCDMPDANTLTVGIFAVLAQHERELISQRTKAALAAKKAQGAQLGTPANLTPRGDPEREGPQPGECPRQRAQRAGGGPHSAAAREGGQLRPDCREAECAALCDPHRQTLPSRAGQALVSAHTGSSARLNKAGAYRAAALPLTS